MSGHNLTHVASEQFTPSDSPQFGQHWNQYAESFFLKQRSECFVPFLCKSPWTSDRLTDLREVTEALKVCLAQREEYEDLLLSEEEKAQFFHQLQVPLTVYDRFITLLTHLIDNVTAHPIISWLVEQRIIFSYVEKLALIIGQLEELEQAWAKLIASFFKKRN